MIPLQLLERREPSANVPPETFARVIRNLMDQGDAMEGDPEREEALAALNVALAREGFEAFYGEDRLCHLRHVATNTIGVPGPNPHRPFSAAELKKRNDLTKYLDCCSEDELIQEVLLPLFRQLGFHRITAGGPQGQGPRIRQEYLDEIRAADTTRFVLRAAGEERQARRVR